MWRLVYVAPIYALILMLGVVNWICESTIDFLGKSIGLN